MRTYDREEFTRELTALLSRTANIPAEKISLGDDLRDDIGLDSPQIMDVLFRISEKWEVDADIDDLVEVKTVGNVVEAMSQFMSQVAKRE